MQMRFTNVWVSWDPIFKLTKTGKEHDRLLSIIQNFVDKVILYNHIARFEIAIILFVFTRKTEYLRIPKNLVDR